ncbi:TauD/TfdA family dioxygenase [Catellatospora sp. KI3]|uniref:TauD/TfdA family dioxygenase n=1 Tax=Catellatospora sp. KI3 TaxID=3041620 RepID=UPI002482EA17|nr:TauD/TfdA family dioxygenase [Catellatospora sp. KI3]MDI1460720.1 TauD/TfdA family dioxygenase [Catellatospora sp. KI3]
MTLLDIETERDELARELVRAAGALAAAGVTADTVLARPDTGLAAGTRARLAELTRPPAPGVGYRVVKGLFAAFGEQGPTATHWKDVDRARTARFDLGLTLVAALHGEVFGWENQQDGHIVHNILPAPGYETVQVGGSSIAPLTWHTEDAFHPDRADFLLLACVRNPDGVGSRIATTGAIGLSPEQVAALSEPKLVIFPDASYEDDVAGGRASQGMATLWRRDGELCLRYDPTYTRLLGPDDDFEQAYADLGRRLDETSVMVPLSDGDLLIIDNDVAVHGRGSFQARYDGTDRWLKRVLVRAPRTRPAAEQHEHGFNQLQVRAV